MATSGAATPEEYLAELPPDRREAAAAVRAIIQQHLPTGYREAMSRGLGR